MRFFEQKLSLAVLFITIPLLFLPKINLISLDSETAGLRIDDLILLVVGAILMWAHALSNHKLYKIEGWILALTGFSIFSFLSNRLLVSLDILHMDAKIFYAVRILEYFMFFYVGALAAHYFQAATIVRAFFLWNFLLMTLQKFNLAGALTVEGYSADVSTRVQGIASFPSEMGLLLNLLFCYMIWDDAHRSRFVKLFASPIIRNFLSRSYLYWMFCLFGLFVIFTGNRISIVALLICFLFRLKKEFSLRSISALFLFSVFIPLLLAGVGIIIAETASVYQRSADLFSFKNLELAQVVWDGIDMTKSPIGNEVVSSKNYDVSWWLRIHKWIYVIKAYISHPECWLQGLGPGFDWAALDGGFLRILTEYGLIGSWIFWKFFSCLGRISPQVKWMTIALGINMIFFDAYLAYKTMSFLFFTSGYAFEEQLRAAKNSLSNESLNRYKPSFQPAYLKVRS